MKILSRVRYNSPVILTFVLVSFAVFILNIITGNRSNELLFSVYRSNPFSPFFYIRLVCHVFGHSGWSHFSGNMILLLLIGPMLEEKFGKAPLILLMVVTAIVTGLVNILLFPAALLGASGIVFSLIMLVSITSMKGDGIPLTFVIVAVFYFGSQLYDGIFIRDQISNLTHILGGLLGCGFGLLLKSGKGYR